ncbi:MAG: glutaredoxin [Turneriella sp.]|nr:glutaredoxin [Leptospiraceae bacterium]MCX7632378.1 glutaredoxin [Turneriella sp.]
MQNTTAVVIYTKNYCPYCRRAKEFFQSRGIAFDEIDVTHDPEGYAALKARTGHMTVPQIFIRGEFIGGFSDLLEKFRRGEIQLPQ